jgi:hypothetical protein
MKRSEAGAAADPQASAILTVTAVRDPAALACVVEVRGLQELLLMLYWTCLTGQERRHKKAKREKKEQKQKHKSKHKKVSSCSSCLCNL